MAKVQIGSKLKDLTDNCGFYVIRKQTVDRYTVDTRAYLVHGPTKTRHVVLLVDAATDMVVAVCEDGPIFMFDPDNDRMMNRAFQDRLYREIATQFFRKHANDLNMILALVSNRLDYIYNKDPIFFELLCHHREMCDYMSGKVADKLYHYSMIVGDENNLRCDDFEISLLSRKLTMWLSAVKPTTTTIPPIKLEYEFGPTKQSRHVDRINKIVVKRNCMNGNWPSVKEFFANPENRPFIDAVVALNRE